MKRILSLILCAAVVLSAAAVADAARVRFEFDPNDLLDLYGSDFQTADKKTQDNPRLLIAPDGTWSRTWYYKEGAHDTSGGGANQPAEGQAYEAWLDKLDQPGEGLASFNIWLLDKAAAPTWGEILVQNPDNADLAAGTSHSGWQWRIVDITPYGWGMNGYIIEWWTQDPSLYLRPTPNGVNFGNFWFEADLYEDLNGNGYDPSDPGAVIGKPYRIWFGSGEAFNYNSPPPAIQNEWQGVLTLRAAPPIPEPVFFQMGALMGLSGLGLLRLRRKA